MKYITQGERGVKHLALLRRMFLKRMSGKFHIRFNDEEHACLVLYRGVFIGDKQNVVESLRRLLANPVQQFAWENVSDTKENIGGWIAPWIALSASLKNLELDRGRLSAYQHAFSSLPPVILKNLPVHRLNFQDEEAYLFLHQLSLGQPSFDLRLFFMGHPSKQELNEHVRTVLFVFLLGYLRSAPKQEENKKVSVVSRILNRFKTKGAA